MSEYLSSFEPGYTEWTSQVISSATTLRPHWTNDDDDGNDDDDDYNDGVDNDDDNDDGNNNDDDDDGGGMLKCWKITKNDRMNKY